MPMGGSHHGKRNRYALYPTSGRADSQIADGIESELLSFM